MAQGENLTDDELQAMIDEFDRDNDGASASAFVRAARTHLTHAFYCEYDCVVLL